MRQSFGDTQLHRSCSNEAMRDEPTSQCVLFQRTLPPKPPRLHPALLSTSPLITRLHFQLCIAVGPQARRSKRPTSTQIYFDSIILCPCMYSFLQRLAYSTELAQVTFSYEKCFAIFSSLLRWRVSHRCHQHSQPSRVLAGTGPRLPNARSPKEDALSANSVTVSWTSY